MDNDDLRRGKPTSHKVFGEAIAILAGDALLTRAFHVLVDVDSREASGESACAAAARGGASWARPRAPPASSAARSRTWRRKAATTSRSPTSNGFIARRRARCSRACVVGGGVLGGAGEEDLGRLARFGDAIGLAFQVVDDILDATEGADAARQDRGQGRGRGEGHLRAPARPRRRAGDRRPASSARRRTPSRPWASGARSCTAWPASSSIGTREAALTSRRLDVWLVEHGLAESREKAQALVMAGRVRVDGAARHQGRHRRARGGGGGRASPVRSTWAAARIKLEGALDAFGVDPRGRVAVDVGRLDRRLHRDPAPARGHARLCRGRGPRPAPREPARRRARGRARARQRPPPLRRARCPRPAASPPWTCRSSRCAKLLPAVARRCWPRTRTRSSWSSRSSRSGAARSGAVVS